MTRALSFFRIIFIFAVFSFLQACQTPGRSEEGNTALAPSSVHKELVQQHAVGGPSEPPRQIALLLPVSGKHAQAAKALREGFFASYYTQGGQKPQVRIYDTTQDRDVQKVYTLAVDEGANFVVGPLSKEDVLRLSQLSPHQLKAPILALNYNPDIRMAPPQFLQYSLAPEEEAEQIAEKAWQRGLRSASIIVPENAWGRRIASAFTHQWHHLGGRIIHTVYANPSQDQSAAVRRLLGINESQNRTNQNKEMASEKAELQPKPHQVVDMIMMAAPPEQARQLKPLFDFYYAEDVPVYATSSIYSGTPNPKKDRDLNGVIFCDMPGLLNLQRGAQLRQLLQHNGSSDSEQSTRLFAMGADAYQLAGRLGSLQHSGAYYPGVTGDLSLGPNNLVHRKLTCAKMVNGAPVLVN